ncbi:MAG: DoxX family protein [candidate division Zixibacteria bacterium]|nr:DoxX family protein [candidate division Zixibacteria bacterium]MCI0595524.1 DoxX family protein [candidate division Zixibacteria bacterium]
MIGRLQNYRDTGLLILRIGFGGMYLWHGWPKLSGGPERWTRLGGAMGNFSIDFFPTFWGFMAAVTEFFGGLCLIFGVFFGWAALLMVLTMAVAAVNHFSRGDGLSGASHAIENGIVLFGLIFIGPGKYSLASRFRRETGQQLL